METNMTTACHRKMAQLKEYVLSITFYGIPHETQIDALVEHLEGAVSKFVPIEYQIDGQVETVIYQETKPRSA